MNTKKILVSPEISEKGFEQILLLFKNNSNQSKGQEALNKVPGISAREKANWLYVIGRA